MATARETRAIAAFERGIAFLYGRGVPRAMEKSIDYFREAAELGHEEAAIRLVLAYREGVGVAQDLAEAKRWAKQVVSDPWPETFRYYLFGPPLMLLPPDPTEAQTLYEQGLAYWDPKQACADYHAGLVAIQKAARLGHARAQYLIGMNKEVRKSWEVRPQAELAEFQAVSALWHEWNWAVCGPLYFCCRANAERWLRLAAEQGCAEAQCRLALVLRECMPESMGDVVWEMWLRRAARQGFLPAQHELIGTLLGMRSPETKAEAEGWRAWIDAQGYKMVYDRQHCRHLIKTHPAKTTASPPKETAEAWF
ncbi:MAG: tetratricopeptide repeat protein [Elusimicrobiales bacterium]|nr:tetratricopeptide repeat protein [Elusimicrobiales bacterium]